MICLLYTSHVLTHLVTLGIENETRRDYVLEGYAIEYHGSDGDVYKRQGDWPGTKMTESEEINGEKYWTYSFDDVESFNVILTNGNSAQSGKFEGITGDIYLEYDLSLIHI